MIIGVPTEKDEGEPRVSLVPESVKKLTKLEGVTVIAQAGLTDLYAEKDYEECGVRLETSKEKILEQADVVLRLNASSAEDVAKMKPGALHISHLDPFNNKELVEVYQEKGVSAISMEMIPRTTVAQKMDALSSQASLAGYEAVVIAAERSKRIFPMMMTPSGTISPTKVFIIGAGVAGLQAIATARRLGARVEAFDTRPVVEEQVQSLGAKFVKLDLGGTGQTDQGYAKALTEEQLAKQRELMAKHCIQSDVVITTAKLFGRKAPVLVTADTIARMKSGSVLVDLAVSSGGNVEGSLPDQEVNVKGVRIIGIGNLPGRAALNASQMYSSNLTNLICHAWNEEKKSIDLESDDEIVKGCLITHNGEVVNSMIKEFYGKG